MSTPKRTTFRFGDATLATIDRHAKKGERTAFLARLVKEYDACERRRVPGKIHELKCRIADFCEILGGGRSHWTAKDERTAFNAGDLLRLMEWSEAQRCYTGRGCSVRVTDVIRDSPGLPPDLAIMSIRLESMG